MKSDSGQTNSVWMGTAGRPSHPSLTENLFTDVCIIGAGIAGLTTAYLLLQEGKSVVVLDDGRIGGGMTERTTAHLSNALDSRYFEIEYLHGVRAAQLAAQSHTAAIDRIEGIVLKESISCDFRRLDGYLFAPPGDESGVIAHELEAVHRAGLTDVALVERAPLVFFKTGQCLRFPRQAQIHPLRYLTGLDRAIERLGGRVFSGTHVASVQGGTPARVKTADGHLVTSQAVVVATNTPINDVVTIHTKQAGYITYAIGARIPVDSVARALFWDTVDPFHYVRTQRVSVPGGESHDLLIVGGEDHKTGQADDGDERHRRLEMWARERFPMIEEIETRWSGQVMEPVDGLAFIGRNPGDAQNVYIATGDSGQGMNYGTIAGILLTDLIAGRVSPWASLYDPARITLLAFPEYVKENLNVAAQYAQDFLTGGTVENVTDIPPNEGGIIQQGLHKIAVYRDETGVPHERSALCPHLGGIVRWNHLEKTWDCPCHGSRFDCFGQVIQGPANRDLDQIDGEKIPLKAVPHKVV